MVSIRHLSLQEISELQWLLRLSCKCDGGVLGVSSLVNRRADAMGSDRELQYLSMLVGRFLGQVTQALDRGTGRNSVLSSLYKVASRPCFSRLHCTATTVRSDETATHVAMQWHETHVVDKKMSGAERAARKMTKTRQVSRTPDLCSPVGIAFHSFPPPLRNFFTPSLLTATTSSLRGNQPALSAATCRNECQQWDMVGHEAGSAPLRPPHVPKAAPRLEDSLITVPAG